MEIRIPEIGESVYEALLVKWHKHDGDPVHKDEVLCEIETDKVAIELHADADGVLSTSAQEGETVKIGEVIGVIDEGGAPSTDEPTPRAEEAEPEETAETKRATQPEAVSPQQEAISPAARRLLEEHDLQPEDIQGSGREGRITIEDVLTHLDKLKRHKPKEAEQAPARPAAQSPPSAEQADAKKPPQQPQGTPASTPLKPERTTTRKPMTPIRKRIAERLLAARQQTAMLTTFNEADLSRVITLRQHYKEDFKKRHEVSLGFMSFFVKACTLALQEFPEVNGQLDGNDIVYHNYYDIGIAIGGERGLVVPVIRDADRLHFAEIEKTIEGFVDKVKRGSLTIAELEGGTFTISNGGVYGSLLSTPILNPPQSAILGMHAIQDRPVARDGQVVIRPMMYLALSYDHRIIDGRQSVSFLKKLKQWIESPEKMFLET